MELEQARQEQAALLATASGAPGAPDRLRAVRQWLVARGAEALRIDPVAAPGLPELIRRAASAPASAARRTFAVLLLDAHAVPGLLSSPASQARIERALCALLETALPHALRRAGYPFGRDLDARRRCLATLAASIDEHMRPLEPSIPLWLSGLPRP
ncbi:MAG TPA: hypothetical protein VMB34_02970 [Acetobacteraceae bacterium]|nr:hypothetical protein [Acetobacteraceae bacterium]